MQVCRRLVGVVPQALQLFGGTIRDNLMSLFDSAIFDDAIWDALQLAGIAALVDGLPDRFATRLAGQGGGQGTVFSAGRRQLLALARAVVLRPAVLLLDEATAVIDAASDAAFRAALRQADRVAVVEDGRVVEVGSPARLLAADGRFATFADLEAAGWEWQEPSAAGVGEPPVVRSAPSSSD